MTSALERALIEGIDAVERQGLRYAIVGGLAVGAWGVSLASLPRLRINFDYVREWAGRLDASIGGDEVSSRVQESLSKAKR